MLQVLQSSVDIVSSAPWGKAINLVQPSRAQPLGLSFHVCVYVM